MAGKPSSYGAASSRLPIACWGSEWMSASSNEARGRSRVAPGFGRGSAPINNEWSGARYFASNQRDRNPRLVCFDLQSSSNSSTVSARRCTIGPGVESHRPFGRRRAASWLYLCAAGLQHIARASLEVGQGQSLEVAKQKLPTSERILYQVVERPYQKPRRRVGRGL